MDSGDFAGTERFEIAARLGAGGMGIVYKAFDREHGTHVALKTLARIDARDLLRFKAEFRALSDVRHPNLVSFGELFESTGRWFFTMELVDGVDFRTWVTDASWLPDAPTLVDSVPGGSTPLPNGPAPARYDEGRLRAALALAARGLAALHGAGKVHRDIKPSNIMVTPEGRVVILDFGLVTDALPSHPSLDTQIAGTVAYMSPEQAASKAVGPESDWYSLGVMLYEILTGRLPHTGAPLEILMNKQRVDPEPPRKLVAGVPEDLDRLCTALLRFDPAARPRQEEILRRLAVDRASELTVSRSSSSDPAAVFIGREQALAELARRFQETRRGKPSTLCLVGESGVGKSALVHHFTQSVQHGAPDTVVLSGRCYETEWVPFKAVDGVVDALSSYLSRIPRADAAALLPRHAALLAQVFPVLRRVDVIAQAPRPLSDALPPQELRTHVFAAVRELFARLADRRPLILTIDDLQWADTDSMALLREVLREPDAPKLQLLLTMRPRPPGGTFDPRALIGADADVLPLEPLPPDEARDLARMLLGPRTKGDDAATIADEAGGHPLFIQELVRHRQTVGGDGPAPRLDEALGARIARLDAAARRLLEVICLAGGPIGQELSAHAAELELSAFARQVSVLRVASMVRTTGTRGWDRIEPYHDRIREAVVGRLDAGERRKLHRRLALAFEGSASPDPEMLVLHWQGTGELVVAARHAVAAARRATESLAFDRAARFYRIALELGPRGAGSSPRDTPARELWELLGDALANAGRGREAAAAYVAATEDANQAEALDLRRRAAEQLLRSGHVDEGLEAIAHVLSAVDLTMPRTPRRALAALLARRAQIGLRGMRFTERDVSTIPQRDLARVDVCWAASTNLGLVDFIIGAYFQSVSLMLALRAGDPARVVRALAAEATYSSAAGGPTRKRTAALVEKTRVLADRLGDPYSKAWVKLAMGASGTLEGRWHDGRDACLAAEKMFRDECTGGAWEITTVRWFGALSTAYAGELTVLAHRVHEALRQAEDRGDLYATVGQSTGQQNLVWLVADDVEQARARLRDAMARWSRRDTFHVEHWWAMQADAQIDLYRGDGAAALAGLAARWSALERSLIMRCQLTRLEAWSVRGRAALAAGDPRAAEQDARRIARERMAWADPVAALLRAGIAAARGDAEKAIALLASAVPAFEAADMKLHAAVARRRLGALRGGDSGREVVAAADAWMAGQDVRSPDRLAAVLAPGFRE